MSYSAHTYLLLNCMTQVVPHDLPQFLCTNDVPACLCHEFTELAASEAAEAFLGQMQDCEFTYLSTQVLHLLGMEGPRTKEPAKYIRYIYNRVILENATVRAAAVSSLAQFGALVEDLRPRIQVLLKRALHDNDDEVLLVVMPPVLGDGLLIAECTVSLVCVYSWQNPA